MRKRTTVTQASAMQFRVPNSRGPRRGDLYAHNVIVRLDATPQGQPVQGIGEAAPRGWTITGDTRVGSWRFLEAALGALEGAELRRRPADARDDIAGLMVELRQLAVRTSTKSTTEQPYRGILAGLESALLDLAAKAAGCTVAELLGAGAPTPPAGSRSPMPVNVVSASLPERKLHKAIAARAGSAIKLADVPDCETALALALRAAKVFDGPGVIWLGFGRPQPQPQLLTLVETLLARIAAGVLPPHVVVEQPAGPAETQSLLELQAAAPPPEVDPAPGPGVVVMAGVATDHHARELAAAGVRSLSLSPQRLGGAQAVLGVAAEIRDRLGAAVRLGLGDVPHISDVGARALSDVATGMPGLDYVAVPRTAADGVRLAEDGSLVLTSAVAALTRFAAGPATPVRPMSYGGRPANVFDVDPLLPFVTPKGEIRFASPLVERAALSRGLDTVRMNSRELVVDHHDLPMPLCFTPSKSPWTGRPAHRATVDKELTRTLLQDMDVPVPHGTAFDAHQVDDAVKYALSLAAPVVVKPRNGIHGTGVSTDLRTEAEVRAAIAALDSTAFRGRPFIVETFIPGDDYRLLVVGDQVVSVVLKRPASVVGDGSSRVVDLVLEKNRWRLENPHTRSCLLGFGGDAMYWLGRQGLTPDSVPDEGRFVRLGSAGNIAAGGESIEVLDETHPSMLELAVRAVHAVPGLDHAGIDLMGDHLRAVDGHPAAIIEVNGNPATTFNHFPLAGTPRDVSSDLVLRSCSLAGFDPGAPRDRLTVRIEVDGRVQNVGYRAWFAAMAQERQVTGSIRNLPEGGVEVLASGPAAEICVLASSAILGSRRAVVTQVRTTHLPDLPATDRFEVLP
nr:acylphosphatase [Phytoactinopolyspora alkaliphila]